MTMQRREQWLQLSSMNKCWLIEDDYAAEYSFEQHPAPSLLSHSTTGHVIHVGTMSKLLFPGLRLGWMVVPSHICEQVIQASNTAGLSPSYVIQQQLALFIQYGQLATHLAQTRQLYNQRRRAASGFLKQHAAELLNVTDSISGMNLYLELNPQRVALEQLPERLATAGLGGELFVQQQPQGARFFLLIGHAALAQEDLSEHLNRLIHCLRLDS
jgi:GntR family transcriptional regulator/MocR family aminotransferase